MKLYRKYFSKKHDENWYRGEETENQKKNRKALTRSITGTGTAYGAAIGSNIAYNKAYGKATNKVLNALDKDLGKTAEVVDVISKTSNKVRPEDRGAYLKLLEDVEKRLEHNKSATAKFGKKAQKIVYKSTGKGALKGAAILTAVGGGLAYLANKGVKDANEKANSSRRNKNKEK